MTFDLRRGPINDKDIVNGHHMAIVWRDDSWLHYNNSAGMSSIFMTEKNALEFAEFLQAVAENPNGYDFHPINGKLHFQSESHSGLGFEKHVNILISGQSFVTIFNMPVTNLIRFSEYMIKKSKVG